MTNNIIHDKAKNRFVLSLQENLEAYVSYRINEGVMELDYSYVPNEVRGKGIGKKLVESTFELITEQGYEAVALCSYIKKIAVSSPKWITIIK